MNLFNSKFILSNKRFGWIDYDRGISIILVTYRHCYESMEKSGLNLQAYPFLEYINVFFFGFRMPLFFIASGIFVSGSLRKRGLKAYSKIRVQNILYPMLVWGCIQISLQILLSSYANSDVDARSYWYLLVNPRATGQFWYLNALFCVGIIYSFLKVKLKARLWHQLLVGIILYTLVAYIRTTPQHLGFAMDIFEFYIFFAIGDAIAAFLLSEKAAQLFTSWKLVVPLLTAFLVIQYFFTKINLEKGNNYFVEHHMPVFFLLVALVGCALSITVSFSLKKNNALKPLRVIGFNSVHIYCMQILAMALARIVFLKLGVTYVPLLTLMVLATGVFLPMLIYNICLRLNMWWLFTLLKPEEEIQAIKESKKQVSTQIVE